MAEAEKIAIAALRGRATIVVIDNLESVLAPADDSAAAACFDAQSLQALLDLIQRLSASGKTRLLFTSRERLPAPFDSKNRTFSISRLSQGEAVQLVLSVLEQRGIQPKAAENVTEREQLEALVDAGLVEILNYSLLQSGENAYPAAAYDTCQRRRCSQQRRRRPDPAAPLRQRPPRNPPRHRVQSALWPRCRTLEDLRHPTEPGTRRRRHRSA